MIQDLFNLPAYSDDYKIINVQRVESPYGVYDKLERRKLVITMLRNRVAEKYVLKRIDTHAYGWRFTLEGADNDVLTAANDTILAHYLWFFGANEGTPREDIIKELNENPKYIECVTRHSNITIDSIIDKTEFRQSDVKYPYLHYKWEFALDDALGNDLVVEPFSDDDLANNTPVRILFGKTWNSVSGETAVEINADLYKTGCSVRNIYRLFDETGNSSLIKMNNIARGLFQNVDSIDKGFYPVTVKYIDDLANNLTYMKKLLKSKENFIKSWR